MVKVITFFFLLAVFALPQACRTLNNPVKMVGEANRKPLPKASEAESKAQEKEEKNDESFQTSSSAPTGPADVCFSKTSTAPKSVWISEKIICESESSIWNDEILAKEKEIEEAALKSLKQGVVNTFKAQSFKLYQPKMIETLMPTKTQLDSKVKNIIPSEEVFKHLSTYGGKLDSNDIRFFAIQATDPKGVTIARTSDGKVYYLAAKSSITPGQPVKKITKVMCGPDNIFKKCSRVIVDTFPGTFVLFELADGETFSGSMEIDYEYENIEFSFTYEKTPRPTEFSGSPEDLSQTYAAHGDTKTKKQNSLKNFWADLQN